MKAIHNDVVLGTSVAILAALGCYKATEFGPDARIFPFLILIPAVVVGIVIAIRGQLKLVRSGDNPVFFGNPKRFFMVVGLMIAALISLNYLGFLTTSAILIPTLSYLLGYRKALPIAVVTVGFLLVIYIVFIQLLARPLPPEIWALMR